MTHGTEHLIEHLKIYNLHGERDVTLFMKEGVKILVGDNGSGKTTVLHCLYSILSHDFYKLSKIDFDKIEIKFASGDIVDFINKNVSKSENILGLISKKDLLLIKDKLSARDFDFLLHDISEGNYDSLINHSQLGLFDKHSSMMSRDLVRRIIRTMKRGGKFKKDYDPNDEKKKLIEKNFPYPIYYLPTYRRIEEDFKNLGHQISEIDSKDQLIQFGMADVKQRFKGIKEELKDSAVSLYTNLNGKMLTQLTMDFHAEDEQYSKIFNTEALKIVLARVGDSISSEVKGRILELIGNKKIKEDRYHPLVFVLSNLIDVYDEQKDMDDAIKEFVNVINKYLVDKEFSYDESRVEIQIVNKRTGKSVQLEKLSSGEKQLISVLSKLYLEQTEKYAVIFDEPELSLSIEWQETLLPDILKSKKCSFLLAATHSPFIFDNELDQLTGSLKIEYKDVVDD